MRPTALVLLIGLAAAVPPAGAADDDEKLKAAASEAVIDFKNAFAERRIDDAMRLVGTPFTYGAIARNKAYAKPDDVKALLKRVAPGGINWKADDGAVNGAFSVQDLAGHKAYKGLKGPLGAVLGKTPGFAAVYERETVPGGAVIIVAVKDGKPQVVGLLIN